MQSTLDDRSAANGHDSHFGNPRLDSAKADIVIAYIGGGSRQWAPILMGDLALSSCLTGELRLYDIDQGAAETNARIGGEIFSHSQAATSFRVRAEPTLESALAGADFVVISIEPGPITCRYADLEIPAKYGILQTVGDTTGPGGLLRAMRSVPMFTRFAEAIMEHCPQAWVINYTNPMALCTAALFAAAPDIKAIGCCHEVFGTQRMLSRMLGDWLGVEPPPREEVILSIAGVNHFTWATSARWQGFDILAELRGRVGNPGFFAPRNEEARRAFEEENWFESPGLVACDLLRRFGALGAAGDRHLVEFVPWYLESDDTLNRWGVVRTPYSWRLKRNTTPVGSVTVPLVPAPSGEEGVLQIEALLGLRSLTTNINLPNRGQMRSALHGPVVETYARFGRDSVEPLLAPELPRGADALVQRAIFEQDLTLQAALTADVDLAFQALLIDPLVRIPTDRAWAMFSEMREAVRNVLPNA